VFYANLDFYSLLIFVASNVLYLLIRAAQKQGIAISFYSIFFFLVPAVTYFAATRLLGISLVVSGGELLLILGAGLVWSYAGNFFSQKGIALAANPGYSLVIQKSAAVFTTIAAVFLFGAQFDLSKFTAILLILGMILFMNLGERAKQSAGRNWLLFSVLANLCFTFGQLISKHFLNLGLEPLVYLFYINSLVALLNAGQFFRRHKLHRHRLRQLRLLLGIGLASVVFNLSMQVAFRAAPNIGYVAAINVASIMSITLLSALLFGDELSRRKVAAMAGVMLGLGWLVVG